MKVTIDISEQMYGFLESLLKTGRYGKSIEEVAGKLLIAELGNMLMRGEIETHSGRKGPQRVNTIPRKEGA